MGESTGTEIQLNQVIRLNLGGGIKPIEGFINIDRVTGEEVYPLDYPDGSVDQIRASHVLEHFSHQQVSEVVNHWVAKLKPGGCLRIAVPDFEKVAAAYLKGVPINVQGHVMGGHLNDDDRHGCLFDRETLQEILVNAGLERLAFWQSEVDDCANRPESLNMMGFKPSSPESDVRDVVAVMQSARFGPALHHRCAYEAFFSLGIPYHVSSGCFWHQLLSKALEEQLAQGRWRYILISDFDTLFKPEDVRELWRLMRAYDADAIAPLQQKRNADHPLFHRLNPDGSVKKGFYRSEMGMNLMPVDTAHFGLTLIKAEKLANLERPWFLAQPNSEGRWDDGQVDADIYFWKRWKAAGNTLFLAPRVVVGHMEEVITWPDKDFKAIRQNITDYVVNGQPKGVFRYDAES